MGTCVGKDKYLKYFCTSFDLDFSGTREDFFRQYFSPSLSVSSITVTFLSGAWNYNKGYRNEL